MCIGGPALIYYVTPTEEELFKARYTIPEPEHWYLWSAALQSRITEEISREQAGEAARF